MADFAYLVYYKEHPSDKMAKANNDADNSKLPIRQRGASVCAPAAPSLTPVVEDDQHNPAQEERRESKTKRRFSLDFLFSKKKQFNVTSSGKRGSTASNASESDEPTADEIRRASINSIKLSKAEVNAWVYS